ncbi:5-formyltetrahydrofolate cyclo-ligase [Rubellicoccus peritrichatus]|uniref:5-formyltetrahydrofolate cyclo-ligase n=1 Tax=Rubellicoccus peritrichatus TaxID=3080537 RepID=A0AAQ3LFQ9_9BACT|nr:5-formyltetrahydrofolate cyclo-ligase [Puniceicoccus sp. CR14]WOO41239.1 5-formyltetrahydrofolate cyclo-ligase [Puniceicoccus sp. CR14]
MFYSKQKSISSDKQKLRDKVRTMRRALSKDEVKKHSESICSQILEMTEYKTSHSIAIYMAFDNEVDLRAVISDSFGKRRVLCPRIISKEQMEFREIASWDDLAPNKFGIPEPIAAQPVASPQNIDLMLIPGIAFSHEGHRLGLGAGYYDRFLRNTNGLKWGIAYDFQIVDQVPVEEHDHALDRIISDSVKEGQD